MGGDSSVVVGERFLSCGSIIRRGYWLLWISGMVIVGHCNQGITADSGAALGLSTDLISSSSGTAVAKTNVAAIVAPEDNAPAKQYK